MNGASSKKIKVIAVVGATASGKTSYSIELAKKIDAEIISADSRLVYKGFDIGTAKPTKKEMQGIPHYMIDIVEPEFNYSAGLYQQQAGEIIKQIHSKNKTPIIVGGTGLYIDILLKNYQLPHIEANNELRKELQNKNTQELYDELLNKDTIGAQQIDSNDKKKIIRALEIIYTTGKPLSKARGIDNSPYEIEWIGKNFPRDILYQRINERVDIMIETGLVEETKHLLSVHGRIPNLTDTIGYREIIGYLDNSYSLEEAKELLKKNTRNYAKRQLTWFRKNQDIKWDTYPQTLKK